MLIDSHCHINNNVYKNIEQVIKNAEENDVKKFLCIGFDKNSNDVGLNLTKKLSQVFLSVGIHPCECENVDENYFEELENLIKKNPKIIAIGETGLDYYHKSDNKELQKKYFLRHIEMAQKFDLPLIIHARDSIADIYDILKSFKGKIKGVMHCFSSSLEMAFKFIEIGFYISFSGVITFKNNKTSETIIKNIDINKVLIETDCPYLSPEPYRGKVNEPAFLKFTFEKVVNFLNIDEKALENILENNFNRLFQKELL